MPLLNLKTFNRRWRLVLLALLCVAGSQLAVAGHQFQHDEVLVTDTCAVCVQLEQLDAPLPSAILVPAAPAYIDNRQPERTAATPVDAFTHYFGRAPPAS